MSLFLLDKLLEAISFKQDRQPASDTPLGKKDFNAIKLVLLLCILEHPGDRHDDCGQNLHGSHVLVDNAIND